MVINMIFLIILVAFIVAIFFIPIKFEVYANIKGKNVYKVDNLEKKTNNLKFVFKILGFLPVYWYNSQKHRPKKENYIKNEYMKQEFKNKVKNKEIDILDMIKYALRKNKNIKFKKMVLVGGFNTEDYVKNAYINASLNTIICMIINANQKNFNLDKLYYQVSISNYNYYLATDCIISFSLAHNIGIIMTFIKTFSKLNKSVKERLRSENKYGRTSNRKFNDNSNEFA